VHNVPVLSSFNLHVKQLESHGRHFPSAGEDEYPPMHVAQDAVPFESKLQDAQGLEQATHLFPEENILYPVLQSLHFAVFVAASQVHLTQLEGQATQFLSASNVKPAAHFEQPRVSSFLT